MIRCGATNARGQPCGKPARRGSVWCWWHQGVRLECFGGPWDGLRFTHLQPAAGLIFDASQPDRSTLAAGWRVWDGDSEGSSWVRGFYVRDNAGPSWRWVRARASAQVERAGG